ncbi:sterile alpha motif domain-containing protein 3-like isoform X2 [Ornithodoros turicata]|uniref:sterile alpha motif domain-containing protein 3-like isoform X2 n=1 Tax=Ornithodoros turicata TaxID=34597 RepID=UPI00313A2659
MASVSCLVVVQSADIARKLTLQDPHLAALKDAVRACRLLAPVVNLDRDRFQVFDDVFKRNIDLADDDVIPDKAEIFVVATETPVLLEPKESSSGVVHSSILTERMNVKLEEAILTPSVHKKIVEELYQSMIRCTLYPSAKFYSKVANSLVTEYRNLADDKGSGFDSWVISLRNKFKNERRKITNNEMVKESRAKYGVKRDAEKDMDGTNMLQRNKIPRPSENAQSTFSTSDINKHEEWLLDEYLKQQPDVPQMFTRLEQSFQERSKQMRTTMVLDSVRKFPYIMDFKIFMHEFELLTQKDAVKAVEDAIYKVLHIVTNKDVRCAHDIRSSILGLDRFQGCQRRKKHLQALLATRALSDMFKETRAIGSLFVHESTANAPPTPHISYTGSSVEEGSMLKLVVENVPLYHVVEGMEGISSIISAYWIFNASYCQQHLKTISFFENVVGLQATPLCKPVVSFLKKYNALR